jgi:hypothetical protein
MHQKKKIALEISAKIASVNGPSGTLFSEELLLIYTG